MWMMNLLRWSGDPEHHESHGPIKGSYWIKSQKWPLFGPVFWIGTASYATES